MYQGKQLVYALSDPNTSEIRYIGQSVDFDNRKKRYDSPNCCHSIHLGNWLRKLVKQGTKYNVTILQECETLAELNEAEINWIRYGRSQGWKLINQNDGGRGWGKRSEASKEVCKERSKALWKDGEYQQKFRNGMLRRFADRKGMTVAQYESYKIERKAHKLQMLEQRRDDIAKRRDEREAKRGAKRIGYNFVPLTYNGAAFVPLTNGRWAVVDIEDWDIVNRHRWSASLKSGSQNYWRAKTNIGRAAALLSRYVMGADRDARVVISNGNALDCRRSNLQLYNGAVA
jgi:hypothetical protein